MSNIENLPQDLASYLEPVGSRHFVNPDFKQLVMTGVDALYALLSTHAAEQGPLGSDIHERQQALSNVPCRDGSYDTHRHRGSVSGTWYSERRLSLFSLLGERPADYQDQPVPTLTAMTTVHMAASLTNEQLEEAAFEEIWRAADVILDTERTRRLAAGRQSYYERESSILGVPGVRVPRRFLGFLTRGYDYSSSVADDGLRQQLGNILMRLPDPAVAANVRVRAEFPLGGAASDPILRVASGDQELFIIEGQEPTPPDSNAARYRLLGAMLTLPDTHDVPRAHAAS